MKALSTFAAAAILLGATAALAEDDQAAAKQEKKVCKTEKMTGSLTRVRRTCLTQSEWDRLAEGSRKNYDAITRDANQTHTDAINNRDSRAPGAGGF